MGSSLPSEIKIQPIPAHLNPVSAHHNPVLACVLKLSLLFKFILDSLLFVSNFTRFWNKIYIRISHEIPNEKF